MATRVGVGTSSNRDSHAAGVEAARVAYDSLDGANAAIVLVAATAGYRQQQLVNGVREVFPKAPMSGCSAEGVITRGSSAESSHAVGVVAIASDENHIQTFHVQRFAEDSAAAGRRLANEILERAPDGRLVMLFPDGIAGNCTQFIRALDTALSSRMTVIGGTAGDLLDFQRTYQFHDGDVFSDSVAAVVISGEFDAEIAITHGCDLIGAPRTITRAENGFVYAIDGHRAWDLFREYLDSDAETLEALHIAHLLLAEHLPVSPTRLIDDFTVRVPVRLDNASGALYFAAGLTEGTRVQIALRNAEKVCERAVDAVRDIAVRRPGEAPLLMLQLDCAGRGRLLLGEGVEDRLLAPMHHVFGDAVPWFGMNTYGEIGPVDRRVYFHNYTAVLCALYPRRPASP
jgi:hypothetical protein